MTAPDVRPPLEVFISYSHADEGLRIALVEHLAGLQRNGVISLWHDERISGGDDWEGEIDTHLLSAQMILLLVSPSFMASSYCERELRTALKRREQEGIAVIPVILRPVDIRRSPFAHLQALPRNAKAVTEWPDTDVALRDVASRIRDIVEGTPGGVARWGYAPVLLGSWRRLIIVAIALTLMTRLLVSSTMPLAPLGPADTIVVFLIWAGACEIGRRGWRLYRRRRQDSPKKTNGAQK
jgi:hypothetical protein